MGFSDDIKKFTDNAKGEINKKVQDVKANAERRLIEVLGEDAKQIKSISLDTDVGKFHTVDAPAYVVEKLRLAGLLKQ